MLAPVHGFTSGGRERGTRPKKKKKFGKRGRGEEPSLLPHIPGAINSLSSPRLREAHHLNDAVLLVTAIRPRWIEWKRSAKADI